MVTKKAKKESKNFSLTEFRCPCCGQANMSPLVIGTLQTIRDKANERFGDGVGKKELQIIVNSGYRCPAHNAKIGGAPGSQHTRGMAADIYIPGWKKGQLLQFVRDLYVEGHIYIGYAYEIKDSDRAVHVDTRIPESETVRGWLAK